MNKHLSLFINAHRGPSVESDFPSQDGDFVSHLRVKPLQPEFLTSKQSMTKVPPQMLGIQNVDDSY